MEHVERCLFKCIRKVVDKVQFTPCEGIGNDLFRLVDSEFDRCAAAIRKFGGDYLSRFSSNPSAASWFDQKLEDARKARHLELKLLAAEVLKSDQNDTHRVLYNSKHERVGIVESDN